MYSLNTFSSKCSKSCSLQELDSNCQSQVTLVCIKLHRIIPESQYCRYQVQFILQENKSPSLYQKIDSVRAGGDDDRMQRACGTLIVTSLVLIYASHQITRYQNMLLD